MHAQGTGIASEDRKERPIADVSREATQGQSMDKSKEKDYPEGNWMKPKNGRSGAAAASPEPA